MCDTLKKYLQDLGLPLSEIVEVVSHFRPLTLNTGDHFLEQGKISNSIAFITEGILRIYHMDEKAKDITSYFLNENRLCPLAALTKQPSAYSFQAITPCQLLVIKLTDFDKLLEQLPTLGKILNKVIKEALIEKSNPQNNYKTGNSKKRYEEFLLQHKDFAYRVPLQYIASYIGVTKQSLSRIRRQPAK
ncbi:Crp/Fnr family transcriptional regulator [Pedobacter sp. L105]|uniref:Crp/Fnr family transcriptional regulator n=1 Tax=Pedobacter sp. L105 TaxID=1641871 RepID=UPI00131CC074|nr:Crp/Fnr family transcriptional regulator [Pedobacter sp. L105]